MGPAAVLGAAVLWGTVGPAQVLASSPADPGALGAARLLLGGLVLVVPLLGPGGVRRSTPTAPRVRRWVLVAGVSTAVYQATFLYGIRFSGAALGTAVALGCAPFATGLFSWVWARHRPGVRWLVGTAAAVAGCVVILVPAGAQHVDPLGVLLAVVAGCCYGAYTVAAKFVVDAGAPATASMATTLVLGGLILSPFLLHHPDTLLDARTVGLTAWTGLVGTALAYTLFGRGLRRTSAAAAGTLSLAEPLTATVLGVVVLREHLSATAVVGCTCLLLGLAASLPARRRDDAPPVRSRPSGGSAAPDLRPPVAAGEAPASRPGQGSAPRG